MKLLVWDWPTRIFHWLLAISMTLAFGLANWVEKETPLFYIHVVFGVLAGLLILWRLIWGVVGSKHAKWSELLFSPKATLGYFSEVLKGKGRYYVGHNPGGAAVALAILGGVGLTVISGLLISQAEFFEEAHEILPKIVMIFVVIHIVGVVIATVMHRESYTRAMFTGRKRAAEGDALSHASPIAALAMLVLVLGSWSYFIWGFDRDKALFTAPGTQWTFQVGEPEVEFDNGSERSDAESQGQGLPSEGDEGENDY